LEEMKNESFTDSCLHQFCFYCLLKWSEVRLTAQGCLC
jgi:E3 ubiquitin-protein ligase Topors